MLCGGSCATAKALRAAAAQEQIQGFCCGCLAGSLRAAHQEQEGAQDSRGCAGTCPGHLCRARGSSGLAVTGTPGWSGGPPSSNGVCCPQSLCLPWNPGGKNKCGKWGTGKEPVVCKKKKKEIMDHHRVLSFCSGLLGAWALSAPQGELTCIAHPSIRVLQPLGLAPAGAATGIDSPCPSCASGRSCL